MRAALYSCRKLLMPEVSTTSATPSPAGSHGKALQDQGCMQRGRPQWKAGVRAGTRSGWDKRGQGKWLAM